MHDTINYYFLCGCPRCHRGKVVFRLGAASDVDVQPPKAPQYQRPIREDADVIKDIETEQSTVIHIGGFKDRRGKPAAVDGVPRWATNDSDKLTLEPTEDGMHCKVITGLMPSDPNAPLPKVQVTADGDLSAGEELFAGTMEFRIKLPPAISIDLTVDDPVDVVATTTEAPTTTTEAPVVTTEAPTTPAPGEPPA